MQDDNFYIADEGTKDSGSDAKMPQPKNSSVWLLWLKACTIPKTGWKDMQRSRIAPVHLASAVFYPLLAVASAASFAIKIYVPDAEISGILKHAVATFISFFTGYFLFFPVLRLLVNKTFYKSLDTDFGRCYVMSLLSTLVEIYILYQLLPFLEVLWVFLPAYTLYLAYWGIERFKVPRDRFMGVWVPVCIILILLPLSIGKIFELILPAS